MTAIGRSKTWSGHTDKRQISLCVPARPSKQHSLDRILSGLPSIRQYSGHSQPMRLSVHKYLRSQAVHERIISTEACRSKRTNWYKSQPDLTCRGAISNVLQNVARTDHARCRKVYLVADCRSRTASRSRSYNPAHRWLPQCTKRLRDFMASYVPRHQNLRMIYDHQSVIRQCICSRLK